MVRSWKLIMKRSCRANYLFLLVNTFKILMNGRDEASLILNVMCLRDAELIAIPERGEALGRECQTVLRTPAGK
jgi:hypothetical protein